MSYQVLARKWRPRNFASLGGQEHVVRALTHALEQNRLHHAYLFTGTRGVGKTTLARNLAKARNCETGITATPCGVCSACTEIDSGRFVDLIEIDAATNTGIDNMRELQDNAVYAPTRGRFKVFVIDEVHMLSKQAFNSMLKTFEEPPEHIKFILATTDPQKIPVTVLSRCLQFNLKQMPREAIYGHLGYILQQENTAAEPAALRLIAQAARGSGARDARCDRPGLPVQAARRPGTAGHQGDAGGRRRDGVAQPFLRQRAAGPGHAAAPDRAGTERARRAGSGPARARAHPGAGAAVRRRRIAAALPDRAVRAARPAAGARRIRRLQHEPDAHAGVSAGPGGCRCATGTGKKKA